MTWSAPRIITASQPNPPKLFNYYASRNILSMIQTQYAQLKRTAPHCSVWMSGHQHPDAGRNSKFTGRRWHTRATLSEGWEARPRVFLRLDSLSDTWTLFYVQNHQQLLFNANERHRKHEGLNPLFLSFVNFKTQFLLLLKKCWQTTSFRLPLFSSLPLFIPWEKMSSHIKWQTPLFSFGTSKARPYNTTSPMLTQS